MGAEGWGGGAGCRAGCGGGAGGSGGAVGASLLTALVPVDVAVLSSTVSAVAFVLVPSSDLPVSLLVASACACCSAVACGWMASAMADIGNVALTMDVHAIAQIR